MSKTGFIILGLIAAATVWAPPAYPQVQFTEVSSLKGLSGPTYRAVNDHSLGLNWIDYNNDGWDDLFLVNGFNNIPHLYHNNGDGTFTNEDDLLVTLPNYEMGGSVFADYDNDGDADIYIFTENSNGLSSFGGKHSPLGPPNLLLKNQWVENGNQIILGQPLFIEAAASAGVDDLWPGALPPNNGIRSMTGGFVDYDRDGCVDLFVGHWALNFDPQPENQGRLYRNNCDGTFQNVTDASGIGLSGPRPALAFIGADLDNDLWPDFYVVNFHNNAPYDYDFLFRNNQDGTFTDVTDVKTVTDPPQIGIGDDAQDGMGIDIADIDLDGDWDIYITDVYDNSDLPKGNAFYLNRLVPTGTFGFDDNSAPAAYIAADFSWGVNFFDLDQDGYEDLYVATQATVDYPRQKYLYINNHDGTFTDASDAAGLNNTLSGNARGSATADYDHDGDLDFAVVNQNANLQLFRNDTVNAGGWIKLKLVTDPNRAGTKTNRSAIGAVVKATAGPLHMMRQIKGGSSAHSQDSLVVHFGLGTATTVDELQVLWPSGEVDYLCNLTINQKQEVLEGTAPDQPCADQNQDTMAPTWPTGTPLTGQAVDSSMVALNWTPAMDDVGVVSYTIYRDGLQINTVSGLSHTDSGLNPNTQYCYKISAMDASNNQSTYSNEVCVMTAADTTPPPAPTDLVATVAGAHEVDLVWGVPEAGVSEYRIYRNGALLPTSSMVPTYNDTGLNPDTAYCYTVTAVDAGGNESPHSNESCAMPLDSTAPDPPTGLTAEAMGPTSVALDWNAATDDVGVASYRVYRGGSADPVGTPVGVGFTDDTVAPGTTYTYSVTAMDAAGHESFTSAPVEVTTPAAGEGSGSAGGSGGGGGGGGGCFIATAAYGSAMEPHVRLLRQFRDRLLVEFGPGRAFVRLYERYSPPIARVIAGDERLRALVRVILWPVIGTAWFVLIAPISVKLGGIMVLMLGLGMSRYRSEVIKPTGH